jgi:hypothetical protein
VDDGRHIREVSMFRRRAIVAVIVSIFVITGVCSLASAQEHPEHPKKTEGKSEHPEHPKSSKEKKSLTTDDMAKGIKSYVERDSALKGGHFLLFDPVQSKVLDLKLSKIHLDKLAQVNDGLYFACCDFTSADGNTYDVDFWMKEDDDILSVSEIKVHKDNGVPRYTWVEKDGEWSTAPVK